MGQARRRHGLDNVRSPLVRLVDWLSAPRIDSRVVGSMAITRFPALASLALCGFAVLAPGTAVALPQHAEDVVTTAAIDVRHVVTVRGRVGRLVPDARAVIQMRRGRWVKVAGPVRLRGERRFAVRWHPRRALRVATLRALVSSGGHRLTSRPLTLHFARDQSSAFSLRSKSRMYARSDVARVSGGAAGVDAVVELARGSPAPIRGGHVALAPAPGLPDGMFATVMRAHWRSGRWTMSLARAPVDQVLANASLDVDTAAVPRLVDARGRVVSTAAGSAVVLRGSAAFSRSLIGGFGSMFSCHSSGGIPRSADDLWSTGLTFPISITIDHLHITHRFYAGSLLPHDDPYFLLQFAGQVVAGIGFEAKAAFECELSDEYRENHRLQITVGSLARVPVTMYLEPTFKLEVSAAGAVTISNRHYFAITLEKDGFRPLKANSSRASRRPSSM